MSTEELPDGITLNSKPDININIDKDNNIILIERCSKCEVTFEGVLTTVYSRHEGAIVIRPAGNTAWKNQLSKDRNKAEKFLIENVRTRLDKHEERDHND